MMRARPRRSVVNFSNAPAAGPRLLLLLELHLYLAAVGRFEVVDELVERVPSYQMSRRGNVE